MAEELVTVKRTEGREGNAAGAACSTAAMDAPSMAAAAEVEVVSRQAAVPSPPSIVTNKACSQTSQTPLTLLEPQ